MVVYGKVLRRPVMTAYIISTIRKVLCADLVGPVSDADGHEPRIAISQLYPARSLTS